MAHKRGKINKDDLNSELSYDPAKAYEQSKLANVLFTKELAERLEGTYTVVRFTVKYRLSYKIVSNHLGSGVTVNAVHPGIVDTDIARHMGYSSSSLAFIIFRPLTWPFIKSPIQGCQTVVYLAVDPKVEKISGKYFR